jgi:hypothetical protein
VSQSGDDFKIAGSGKKIVELKNMTEIIIAISLWCGPSSVNSACKQKTLACVVKNTKPLDSKEALEAALQRCLNE